MKKLIMTAVAMALLASPAVASCGSHGGYSGGYGASRIAQPKYSAMPRSAPSKARATTSQPAATANAAGTTSGTTKAKPSAAPAATAQPLKTATADLDAAISAPAAAAASECKKYSATIGAMISVACE
jgi:hypothetical protein